MRNFFTEINEHLRKHGLVIKKKKKKSVQLYNVAVCQQYEKATPSTCTCMNVLILADKLGCMPPIKVLEKSFDPIDMLCMCVHKCTYYIY